MRPVRAKALKLLTIYKASALSGRAAYIGFLAFWVCCLYEFLGLQGVLLILASAPSGRVAYIGFLAFMGVLLI